jgi:flagellar hook-basal body complex protein FliE
MDLRLSPVSTSMPSRVGVLPRANTTTATPDAKSAGFSGALKGALTEVSNAQNNATELQKQVQLENPSVSLEETMVAIQKAQIGFQATLHVRNRMVQAYSDIMNMQV